MLQSPRALLLDFRPVMAFAAAFTPGSLNLPEFHLPGLIASAGLIGRRSVYLLTASHDAIAAAAKFFDRFDDMPVVGWFSPAAIDQWRQVHGSTPSIEYIRPDTVAVRVAAWKTTVADLRDHESFRKAHIPDAIHIPLETMTSALAGLPVTTPLSLICESGARCSFAASLLWNAGYKNLAIVAGGFQAYLQHALPLTTA